jgi:hypothetical protein
MSTRNDEPGAVFEEVTDAVVELANGYGERDEDVDPWEVAAGLLAGTVQFWLFSHQPCDESNCDDCVPISTAQLRLKMLLDEVKELAETSEYFHSPNDANAGRA